MANRLVVIVEDHDSLRSVLAVLFRSEGWQVTEAANGEEGLRLAMQLDPDAIITDLAMPRMSGIAMARSLAEAGRASAQPILAITSARSGNVELAMGTGLFIDVIRKPLVPVELLKAVTQATRPQAKQAD